MGAWVERARLDAEGRSDRESRALASRRLRSIGTERRVALGAGPRRTPTERVRELPRNARRPRTDRLGRRRRVGVRRVAGVGAHEGADLGGARSISTAAPVSTGPRLASRDQTFTLVVIRG